MDAKAVTEKSQLMNDDEPDHRDLQSTPKQKSRSTGTILLAVSACVAIIGASCYIVFSAAQPFPNLLDVVDSECGAALLANERFHQRGGVGDSPRWPSDDCIAQVQHYVRSKATKVTAPRAIQQYAMVKHPLLERTWIATLVLTLVLDIVCAWGRLGERFTILDRLHTWMTRLTPVLTLVVALASLYSNDYDVPTSRLPAALLIGISARVLLQILTERFPNYTNYIGTGYVVAGLYALTQSPVAMTGEMDLAFALTMVIGGRVADRLVGSVSTETAEQPEVEGEKEKPVPVS